MKREQQILQAAEKLFYERSFDGVGVDAIGKEAGVTGSAIYRHFNSKDEILSVLFDQAADALLAKVGEPMDDPREELLRLIQAHVEFAVNHQRLAGIWAREQRALAHADRRNFLRRQHRYLDRWIACLDACFPGHSRDELVSAVQAVQALLMSDATRPPGGRRAPRLRALFTDMALASLTALTKPAAEAAPPPSTAAIAG
ncbi:MULTISPECIES: TetR/AcrR family transcriptional regulator [Protofrankia]|uniref:Regulatory protein TetR n=1 Tax=Candidatus Protofrankia datiscae TaxID=2716812 RepID=F8B3M5_9ACTN|nr:MULTISPECIES: TetR/AcrR family transcriptional regulator [Protofrankia]AEH07863.1 regulatory protein TetR [Candidatus Protofrankia datiscae]